MVILPKESESQIIGWRTFDLRSSFYDIESRGRKPFTIHCFLQSHPRWEKFPTPTTDDIVQISGKLVGRVANSDDQYQYLCCRVEDFSTLCTMPQAEKKGVSTPNSSKIQNIDDGHSSPTQNLTWSAQAHSRLQKYNPNTKPSVLNFQTPTVGQKRPLIGIQEQDDDRSILTPTKRGKQPAIHSTIPARPKKQQSPSLPKRGTRARRPTQKALDLKGKSAVGGHKALVEEEEDKFSEVDASSTSASSDS